MLLKPAQASQLLRHRVALLYSGSALSLAISLVVALIFYRVHWAERAATHELWLGGLLLILALRGWQAWRFLHLSPDQQDSAFWLRRYRIAALLTGTLWGMAGALFFQPNDTVMVLFTVLVIAGISAGALSGMAADFASYRNFVSAALLPPAVVLLLNPDSLHVAVGILVVLLYGFLLKSGHRTNRSIVESLQLGFEKEVLLAELEKEKKNIVYESQSLMKQVMNSAPIALWALDMEGTITFMDGDRLCRQTGIQLPRVGDNLLQVYADHPRIQDMTRRAMGGEVLALEIEMDNNVFEVHYGPFNGEDGVIQGAIGVAIDVTERKRQEADLRHQANYDELTGLPNRTLILARLEDAFEHARRNNARVAVLFLDLDNFKSINDSLGHKAGDELLRLAAQRLSGSLRNADIASRLSGDEFLVLAEGLEKPESAEAIAHKIVSIFQVPFELERREVFVTTSVGVAMFPDDGVTTGDLLQSADTAMYHAKTKGRNTYGFFTREMQERAQRHLTIETELRRALDRHELRLYYQPKVDSRTGAILGAEVLMRWENQTLGSVSPVDFIPVAEIAGLMHDIGAWTLRTACEEAAGWLADGHQLRIAINISPQQFRNTNLLSDVVEAVVETGLPAEALELEITESLLVQDAPETMDVLNSLRELGITLTLDDFGTGYSSLSYLKRFPLQVLKIDRSFICDLGSDHDDDALVDAIVAMGHSLGMDIVAEGAETPAQVDYLDKRDVHCIQGYVYSPPLAAGQFRQLLESTAPFPAPILAGKPSSSVG